LGEFNENSLKIIIILQKEENFSKPGKVISINFKLDSTKIDIWRVE
jgi:hypothetical protein